jgi:hypothetical protein
VRRYPPEAEYNTGGLARCSALEHTTCCLSLLPTSAEQIIFARPTKSLDTATTTTTITLTLARHTTRLSRSAALRITATWGRNIRPSSLYPERHARPSRRNSHRAHARRRNSLARSPAQIDPQLLSSQTRHPKSGSAQKVYSAANFCSLSLCPGFSRLSLPAHTPRLAFYRPPTFAHRSHTLPHALEPAESRAQSSAALTAPKHRHVHRLRRRRRPAAPPTAAAQRARVADFFWSVLAAAQSA